MSATRPRVVFTGIGVLSPIGLGIKPYWEALCAGKNGVKPISAFDAGALPTRIAGEIRNFDAKEYIDRKERKSLKVMARPTQLAVGGTTLAFADAGIESAKLDPTRLGVEFGAGLIASELDELGPAAQISANGVPGEVDLRTWGEQSIPAMPPLWMLKYLPNMLACHVSILHNAQGPNNTITETDAGALLAMGEAGRIIRRGLADVMLTGSADSKMNPLSMTRLCLYAVLTRRNETPEKASRPFDRDRDGMVPGEGAGILVMEALEHARRRGGKIYAELVGFGNAFDPQRTGEGLARAIRIALQRAGVGPEQIDHINAQGYSTKRDDAWEARGIRQVFGECRPEVPVFAGKSYTGSLGSASGAVELAATLMALHTGVLPPTLNYDTPDPECSIPVLTGRAHEVRHDHALKISLTEMGQCVALVVRKWRE